MAGKELHSLMLQCRAGPSTVCSLCLGLAGIWDPEHRKGMGRVPTALTVPPRSVCSLGLLRRATTGLFSMVSEVAFTGFSSYWGLQS